MTSRGREELAAVVALLAHLQQQAFIDLRQREDVRRVHVLGADLVHLVEHVEEVRSVSIRTRSTPDMISLMTFWRGVALGRSLQALQVGKQFAVDEAEERRPACRPGSSLRFWLPSGRGPILPAVRRFERRRESRLRRPRPPRPRGFPARPGCAGRESRSVRAHIASAPAQLERRMMSQMLQT